MTTWAPGVLNAAIASRVKPKRVNCTAEALPLRAGGRKSCGPAPSLLHMEAGAGPSIFIRLILICCGGRSRFLADPDDHIDAADLGAGGRRRQITDRD